MLSYFLKGRKNTEHKNPEVSKTKNMKIMLLSRCEVCGNKNPNLSKSRKPLLSHC